MDCPLCPPNKEAHRVIDSTSLLIRAVLTNMPITIGHTLICPIRHVATFSELKDREREELFQFLYAVKHLLRSVTGARGFNIAWNEGNCAGQSINHFHLHVVPRQPGDAGILEYEPRKFLYRPGLRSTTPDAELYDFASNLRLRGK